MNPHRLKAYILLLIVAVIWGIAGPVIKFTLGGFPPLLFLTYRFGLSTLVAVILFAFLGFHFPKDKNTRLELLLYGFITSTVTLGFLFFGQKKTTALDATLIILINPILISLAGVRFLKERITLKERVGITIAFWGTTLTIIEPFLQNGHSLTRFSGNILVFISLLVAAWGAVLAKKLLRAEVDPLTLTNISFIIGFLTLAPFAILKYKISAITSVPLPYHLGVIFMALVSGSLAYFLANKAQKTIEISEAAVFSYLQPIFAAPLAVVWLGEAITPVFLLGATIITVGVVIAETKKRRYN